jgi:hypothetical protein
VEICPVCLKRAFVGRVELDHKDGSEQEIMLWVTYFCDRTVGCYLNMKHREDPWVRAEYVVPSLWDAFDSKEPE